MIESLPGRAPSIAESAFVAAGAVVVGDVRIGAESSLWYGTVARGDVAAIRIGERTNIQDLCVLHVNTGGPDLVVGSEVTVGHRAILHGATVGDRCLIGMGAILLDGCRVGEESFVAAGAVVLQGAVIPPRSFVAGVPAAVRGPIPPDLHARLRESAAVYVRLAREHAALAGGR